MDPLHTTHEEDDEEGLLEDDPSVGNRNGRGSTKLHWLKRFRKFGKKLVVKYNNKGQPVGRAATLLSSYLGVLGRLMVPITYERWSKVPLEIKEKIWKRVKLYFKLEEWSKHQILSSTSSKWRTFKCHLTSKYIIPFKDKPEVLKHPPDIYDFIKQKHWEDFVRTRLSDEWMKLRQIQKKRQEKNMCNHHMSRKGYANLEMELKRSLGSNDEIDRSILWKEARVNKKGEYDNEVVKERANRIDELMKKRKDGRLSTSGSQDILTMALETPEHRGQVRGVGNFVTPTFYFGKSKSHFSFEAVRLMKERVKFLEETMEKMQQEIRTMNEVGQNDNANIDNCKKASYEGQNSSGYFTEDSLDVSLPKATTKKPQTTKDYPPAYSLNVSLQKGTMKKPRTMKDYSLGDSLDVSLQKATKSRSTKDYSSPPLIKLLIGYAHRLMDENGAIEIHMEAGIIDNESGCFYLMGDDIIQFCKMEEISVTAILTYMRLLYEELKNRNMDNMYRFVDPSALSEETGYKNEHRARELLSRMMMVEPQQLLLLPFNAGNHWMLVVMDPHHFTVYFLDSLGCMPCQNLKNFVSLAFTMFAEKKKGMKGVTWKKVKCPQQPTGVECGYYVMRYMKDIVASQNVPIMEKLNGRDTYSQEEIDEVRSEWAEYVGKFC